jgi:hypothetical protein
MIPVAAPPRVRQRLAAEDGPVRVLHAGAEAWYVDVAGWAVGVLSRDAAHVPCGLRSPLPGSALFEGDASGKTGYLERGTLWLGGRVFRLVRSVDVRAPRIVVRDGFRTANSATVKATPPAQVAEFVRGVVDPRCDDLDDLDDFRMADLVPRLVGAGPGLTPLGDDLLCGWLSAFRAAGVATPCTDDVLDRLLAADPPATTLLSATLVDCARHGEVLPQFGAWLAALGTPLEGDRLAQLRAVGATSGAGLAEGARLALLSLSTPAKAAS